MLYVDFWCKSHLLTIETVTVSGVPVTANLATATICSGFDGALNTIKVSTDPIHCCMEEST